LPDEQPIRSAGDGIFAVNFKPSQHSLDHRRVHSTGLRLNAALKADEGISGVSGKFGHDRSGMAGSLGIDL